MKDIRMKNLFAAALIALTSTAVAQETYENTNLIDNDLNGTARYVGMGGALEALGADISTISTNPAGVGLIRRSNVSTSFGFVSQQDATSFGGGNKTNLSFDQIGFVYSTSRESRTSWINVAFNYHKSRNFDMLVNAADQLQNASQNKLTYQKLRNGVFGSSNDASYSQVDHLYVKNLLYAADSSNAYYYPAQDYTFNRSTEGYIGEYDFNISGSINNRVYLGLTVGLHDVHYKHYSEYAETFEPNLENIAGLTLADNREITGTGVDAKVGTIFCPIENSPFRIGLYVQTPTWYSLTTSNYTSLSDGYYTPTIGESYDYKITTPWKFGFSLGHTMLNCLALGATYEYADYSSMKSRINTGGYYDDWYGDYYEESENDKVMNRHTEKTLKGVSTLKLGMEFMPDPNFKVRLGYNYVSSLYKKTGYKDGTLWSPGSYYASQTDYVNWKDTNRITAGLGYAKNNFAIDLAYVYSVTNGDFYPFENYYDASDTVENNIANAVKVSNKRHQLLLTLGYKF